MTNKSADVLVLGAGILGLSLALKLQEHGREVVLVDRQQAGSATSFGHAHHGLTQAAPRNDG